MIEGEHFRWIVTDVGVWPGALRTRIAPVDCHPYAELVFDLSVYCVVTPGVVRRAIELGMRLGYRPAEPETSLQLSAEQAEQVYLSSTK